VKRAVVDLTSHRPVWSAPDAVVGAFSRALGRGWDVVRVSAASSSDGDGAAGSGEAAAAARGAEVYVGWGVPGAVAAAGAGTLRWAHTAAAGAAASITPELRAAQVTLTNSRGIHAEPIADWVLTAIGFCLRGFHVAIEAQQSGRWAKDVFTDGTVRVREYSGTRVGLVGLGGIGAAVARRCAGLGMDVGAVRRHAARRPPRGVGWVRGPAHLSALARRSDVLVLAAPSTVETRGLVTREVLAALPSGAYLINVARGHLVDEAALLQALDTGRLAGCALDVFAREPLPPDHPFWRHPRVLMFPHACGVSERFWERQAELLVENARRFRAGRRLRNVVNLDLGY
jgi:phosphoglycerate dehydrogenase-like enzyme